MAECERVLARRFCTAALFAAPLSARAANWPQYRGAHARGLDDSAPLPTTWNFATGENIRWQTPIPGLAHASPIVWGDRVYVATAVQAGRAELKVGGSIFACADIGLLTCFDAQTGDVRYSERLSKLGEGFTASPVSDGRHLYFASELGNVYVVPAAGNFSVVATNKFDETCLATPALSGGALFFRLREKLVAVGPRR